MNALIKSFSIKFIFMIFILSLPLTSYLTYSYSQSKSDKRSQDLKNEIARTIQVLKSTTKLEEVDLKGLPGLLIKELNLIYGNHFALSFKKENDDFELIDRFKVEDRSYSIYVNQSKNFNASDAITKFIQISGLVLIFSIFTLVLTICLLIKPILNNLKEVEIKVDKLFENDDSFKSLELDKLNIKNPFFKPINRILQKIKMDNLNRKLEAKGLNKYVNKDFILSISNIFYLIKLNPNTHPEVLELAQKGVDHTNKYMYSEAK